MTTNTTKRVALAAIVSRDPNPETRLDFGIGLAVEHEPGYYPQPKLGRYASFELASAEAERGNAILGLSPDEAARIICSSMYVGRRAK